MPRTAPIVLTLSMAATCLAAASPRHKTPAKPLGRVLADDGITPRAIMSIRDLAGSQGLKVKAAIVTRLEPPSARTRGGRVQIFNAFVGYQAGMWQVEGREVNVYEVALNEVLGQGGTTVGLSRPGLHNREILIREVKAGPEMSNNGGQSWVAGERSGESWRFAFDSTLYTLDRADQAFTPTETKAWAVERGLPVRFPHTTTGPQVTDDVPVFQSMVVVVDYGLNEIRGDLKCVGTNWEIPFNGVRVGDAWVAVSVEPRRFTGTMALTEDRVRTQGYFGVLATSPVWLIIKPGSILVGTCRYAGPDLGHMDRVLDSFLGAAEIDLTGARELPDLAKLYASHRTSNVWLRTDDPDSFSWAADRAFVAAGMSLCVYPPTRNIAYNAAAERAATEQTARWVERIKGIGGKVALTPVPAF